MNKIEKKHCRVVLYVAMIFSICLLPVAANALPMVSEIYEFNDEKTETALLEVSFSDIGGGKFRYDYTLTNKGSANLILTDMVLATGMVSMDETISFFPPGSIADITQPQAFQIPGWGTYQVLGNINIDHPDLLDSESIAWSIVYNEFMTGQNVGIGGVILGKLPYPENVTDNVTLDYENIQTQVPVPEPATILLVCSGLMASGVIVRKKRKSN
jgi:hypothetical protein